MACPHVSGVVALGISYATQLRRHFKADELKELLVNTAVPIDSYMTGVKEYRRYVADIGPQQPMQLNLAPYKNQMGSGQVSAAAFLEAIAGAGSPMSVPNLYIANGGQVALVLARYFVDGESLKYEVKIDDTSVATFEEQGAKHIFKGLKVGSTTASVKASNGETHNFTITVREGATDNGWL